MLAVTNTRTRELGTLARPTDRPLTLYACGPTVYRTAHIGNLRTFLLSDLVRRALAWREQPVRAVQNITDVGHLTDDTFDEGEDKLLVAAGLEGRSAAEVAEHYTRRYLEDADALNLLRYDAYPKATEHISEMLDLVARLEAAGYAYDTPDAVYFDVRRFGDYGALSGNRLDDLEAGHRSHHASPNKRFHADFALWRKAGERRQATWDSPWGSGFPGWHIECSAMGLALLGEHIDVHLGGVDLAFPHHECEIAQSEAVVGHRVVDVWLHGEHLLAEGRKMAKSTGNVFDVPTLREAGLDPLAFRLLCLQARYRTQVNVTWDALRAADRGLQRLRAKLAKLDSVPSTARPVAGMAASFEQRFVAAVEDDLDLPTAVRVAFEVAAGDGDVAGLSAGERAALLRRFDAVLGLDLDRNASAPKTLPSGAAELLERRERARGDRDFDAADALRAELATLGVQVVDTPDGPRWTVQELS